MHLDHKKDKQIDQQRAIAHIRWVSHLNAGGRIQSVSVCTIVGNKSGTAGIGMATAKDTSSAIRKSSLSAKKNMVRVPMCQHRTVYHSIVSKYCASIVLIMPGKPGSGIRCSNTIRLLMNCFGFKDISIKCIKGSRNRVNVLKAVMNGLKNIQSPYKIAQRRGIEYSGYSLNNQNSIFTEEKIENTIDEARAIG